MEAQTGEIKKKKKMVLHAYLWGMSLGQGRKEGEV